MDLPIYELQNDIVEKFKSHHNIIITSPTGSGKSTQLPQILLNNAVAKRILVLQPRRLAAIMLAKRVANEMQCEIGSSVGYITRFERASSNDTNICFITTGVLPRMLLHDPNLSAWDMVIFDEFHERSCLQDISLGLCRNIQLKRPDLKMAIMSATLNTKEIEQYLPNTISLESKGRAFPVTISYMPPKSQQTLWDATKKALVELLNKATGDVLIFMPGAYEINKTIEACKEISSNEKILFLPLYSNLSNELQQRINEPFEGRKVIVATNIAETSITISGVRHVIDSGLAKVNRFHGTKGINLLEIEPISSFSATQRAGRAGREDAGSCIRLWRENNLKNTELEPEVRRIDLSETILLISRFGFHAPDSFPWFTTPRSSSINVAFELLIKLGLLNSNGTITPDGATAVTLPIHPRFSKMLISAQQYNAVPEAALCAALLSERPILLNGNNRLRRLASFFDHRGESVARRQPRVRVVENIEDTEESDIIICLRAIQYLAQQNFSLNSCNDLGINRSAILTIWKSFEHILSNLRKTSIDISAAGSFIGLTKAILTAFPDRLACRRDDTSLICYTAFGRAELSPESITCKSKLFITTDIRQLNSGKQILTGNIAITEKDIREIFPNDFSIDEEMFWHDINQRVEKHHVVKCLGVKIEDKVVKDPLFYRDCGKLLAENIVKNKLEMPTWDKNVKNWISRVRWLASACPELRLITYDFDDYQCILEEFCQGENSYQKIKNIPIFHHVKNVMSFEDQQLVEKLAPEKIDLSNGQKMRIKYRPGEPPRGAARIQELYDVMENPTVADGKMKIAIEILAPNMRPVQITEDLANFWENLYPTIKKQLSRRYPKHNWR